MKAFEAPRTGSSRGHEALIRFSALPVCGWPARMSLLTSAAARRNEFARQPVEQLRMRGWNALRAEIILRLHDAPAKILLPNAVHDDPRRQRIVRGDNPTRQIEAVPLSDGVFEVWFALTPDLSPRERFSRKISCIGPLSRSSRREEALIDFGFRISNFGFGVISLLTSAATRFRSGVRESQPVTATPIRFIAPTDVGGCGRIQTRRHA